MKVNINLPVSENFIYFDKIYKKICYDKAGNLPNKGINFNTQTWGKIVDFLFVWLVGIGFRGEQCSIYEKPKGCRLKTQNTL